MKNNDETTVLSNIDPKYEWIWRDTDSSLWISDTEPSLNQWGEFAPMNEEQPLEAFTHLFRFIQAGESYRIKELLADE